MKTPNSMKSRILLFLIILCTISAIAQPWNGSIPGNIYYNQGNVGIGITNPTGKFQVHDGYIKVSSTLFGFLYFGQDGGGTYMEQVGNNTTNENYRLQSSKSGDNANYSQFIIDPTNGFSFITIGSGNGNVGIGTTSPEAKLTVKGKIVASEIQIQDIGTIPDYVFNRNYQLMSLSRVEDFIKRNKHLPEVPSEMEFKENGMNVADMNSLLLKKIEELTLYLIEVKKEVEELKLENKKRKNTKDETNI